MGYAYYEREGMERGYSVPDVCGLDVCNVVIDRGLSYLCYSCLLYFCPAHLKFAWKSDGDTPIKFDCFAGQSSQCCFECAKDAEYEATFGEPFEVHEYSHPSWDMKLILEAVEWSREQAEENLSPDADKTLLVCTEKTITRGEFNELSEWDG